MDKHAELTEELRTHIIGELHVGRLRPGARLASIREVAQQHAIDHRLAARAYEELQNERLVEIRGRSGVFVATADSARASVLDGRQHWVADVLRQAWGRRVTLAELQHLMRRMSMHGLHCLCVESTTDHLVAISSELASDFGFVITPDRFKANAAGDPLPAEMKRITAQLAGIDVIATTMLHSAAIARLAASAGKEFVPITVNPAVRDNIARMLRAGPLRVVIADPVFQARAEQFLSGPFRDNLKVVLVADYDPGQAHDGVPTLFTKAARREMGLGESDLLIGNVPFIAPGSAEDVCKLIARLSISE